MNALQEAENIYKEHGLNLGLDIHSYLTHGFVFGNPAALLLGRPIVSADGPAKWLEPDQYHLADCWYVRLAVGKGAMRWFISRMPWFLPKLAWERGFSGKGDIRIYDTNIVQHKLS
jgi:hypothetical protein